MPDTSLYFIAIIPPEEIATEITSFKQEMANIYNSKKALRVMPHITLKAPFTIPSHQDATILEWFENIKTNVNPFEITLNGFGAFDNPKNPVIFVKPEESVPMRLLQKDILVAFKKQFFNIQLHFHEEEFHPHMTIAYRDLAYTEFEKAWKIFNKKHFSATFYNNTFYLLKHNGVQWKIAKTRTVPDFS
jgi:2'-5' RNA ligase